MNNPKNPSKRYSAEQAFNEALAHLDELSKSKQKSSESTPSKSKDKEDSEDFSAWEDAAADLEAFFKRKND